LCVRSHQACKVPLNTLLQSAISLIHSLISIKFSSQSNHNTNTSIIPVTHTSIVFSFQFPSKWKTTSTPPTALPPTTDSATPTPQPCSSPTTTTAPPTPPPSASPPHSPTTLPRPVLPPASSPPPPPTTSPPGPPPPPPPPSTSNAPPTVSFLHFPLLLSFFCLGQKCLFP